MQSPKGESLIKLLDDPDALVFTAVREKIVQIGPELLPDLEQAAREAMSPVVHERIEQIISILQFNHLKSDLEIWIHSPHPSLLEGAWLMSRYQFPDLVRDQYFQLIKPLRDEIWLEMSEILTALEKIRVMNILLFTTDRIVLDEKHPDSPGNNYLNRVLETGKANEHSLNLLYAVLGQELGMPVFAVEMPDYPVLSYVDMPFGDDDLMEPGLFEVMFYINPTDTGSVHSRGDISNYLITQSLPLDAKYYRPQSNPEFIKICLQKLSSDYFLAGSEFRSEQVQELVKLWKL